MSLLLYKELAMQMCNLLNVYYGLNGLFNFIAKQS